MVDRIDFILSPISSHRIYEIELQAKSLSSVRLYWFVERSTDLDLSLVNYGAVMGAYERTAMFVGSPLASS